jgi:hypothetical protein
VVSGDINEGIAQMKSFYKNKTDCLRGLMHRSMGYPEFTTRHGRCCTNCAATAPLVSFIPTSTTGSQHSHAYLIPSNRSLVLSSVSSICHHLPHPNDYSTDSDCGSEPEGGVHKAEQLLQQEIIETLKNYRLGPEQ